MFPENIPLSAAIITKNEEKNLSECVKSVSFADDIVVVDSGSTDRTVEIAKEFGCRVFVEYWKGDGPQKNSAIDKCKYEWVLVVDADERIPEETAREIKQIISDPKNADAYSFPRRNYFHDRWIRYCGYWPDRIVRLVRKSTGRFQAITHGRWETSGVLEKVDMPIDHYSFTSYSDMLTILETRSTDMARELFEIGNRANIFTPFFHGIAMFIKVYIFKLGFLNGLDGFIIAITKTGGSFFKYAKLLELQREEKNKENSG
jgi:glycosyltransferase involved in cell wall biosynthesis